MSRREISSNGSVAKRDARSARPTNTPCPGSCADGDGQRDPSPSWWTSCKFRIFFVSFQPRPLEGAAGSVRCESVFHDAGDRRNGGQVGHGPPAGCTTFRAVFSLYNVFRSRPAQLGPRCAGGYLVHGWPLLAVPAFLSPGPFSASAAQLPGTAALQSQLAAAQRAEPLECAPACFFETNEKIIGIVRGRSESPRMFSFQKTI